MHKKGRKLTILPRRRYANESANLLVVSLARLVGSAESVDIVHAIDESLVDFIPRGDQSGKLDSHRRAIDRPRAQPLPYTLTQCPSPTPLSFHPSFPSVQNCLKCCYHRLKATDGHLGRNVSVEHFDAHFSHRLQFILCWNPQGS